MDMLKWTSAETTDDGTEVVLDIMRDGARIGAVHVTLVASCDILRVWATPNTGPGVFEQVEARYTTLCAGGDQPEPEDVFYDVLSAVLEDVVSRRSLIGRYMLASLGKRYGDIGVLAGIVRRAHNIWVMKRDVAHLRAIAGSWRSRTRERVANVHRMELARRLAIRSRW